jgi:FkbM family methyltransferase
VPAAQNNTVAEALSRLLIAWQHRFFLENLTNVETNTLSASMFLHLQKLLKPDLSMEVGAYQAGYSRKMRALFPGIHVAAFEANPEAHRHFRKLEKFHLKRIAYLNLALSDVSGTVTLNQVQECAGLSQRNSLMDRPDLQARGVEVPSITGDSFINEHPAKNIALWIDVEGAQKKVLAGFRNALERRAVASLFIEVEQGELWLNQWQDSEVMGFQLRFGYAPVLCDAEYYQPQAQKNQYNIIFVRVEDINAEFITFMLEGYGAIIRAMRSRPCVSDAL